MSTPRISELDGLRGIAILLVIACHYIGLQQPHTLIGNIAIFGYCGVDLFFVLSGYLIGGILVDNRSAINYFQVFYLRRCLRILPLFVISIVVVRLLTPEAEHFPLWVNLTFTQDIFTAHHTKPLLMGAVWSLAIEEKFYLIVAPTLKYLFQRLNSILLLVVLISPLIRLVEAIYGGDTFARLLPFGRFDSLAIGAGIAILIRQNRPKALEYASQAGWNIAAFVVFYFLAYVIGILYSVLVFSFVSYTVLALIFGSLLLHVVLFRNHWRWLAFRPLSRIGTLSYSIYLMHSPVYYCISRLTTNYAVRLIGSCACTYLIAELSWSLLESRLIRVGQEHRYCTDANQPTGFAMEASSAK